MFVAWCAVNNAMSASLCAMVGDPDKHVSLNSLLYTKYQ
ncbi:hypothetical protein VCHA53O466_50106 [Vibrio chagasii]|nr:hypothetical protein VCHA53O466_50106 [Vibrio chagasii]